jgi:twitching motility two-component system response regulator PilG
MMEARTMSNLVMVVDDSLTVRKILEVSLKRAGLDVISFSDGIEALHALTSSNLQHLPNVVILDVMMPKLNGYAFARLIRSKPHLRHIPILMLTSRDSMVSQLRGRIAGANIYMTKPFKTQDVVQTVLSYLNMAPS